jgi:hypothetical protein
VITHVDDAPLAGLSLHQMIGRLRGPVGSTARLQIQRKDQAGQSDIALVREASRALLDVRVDQGKLVVESVGGGSLFEFAAGKPVVVAPLSEQAFYVDGRYHTQIAFTKDQSGRVSGAVLNPGPWGQRGTRVD